MITLAEISKFERRALFTFALLPVIFFAIHIADAAMQDYNIAVMEHQRELYHQATGAPRINLVACDFGAPRIPGFAFASLFICLALIRPKRFILAATLTLLYAVLVAISVYYRIDMATTYGILYRADRTWSEFIAIWYWDIVGVMISLPLLFWLASIVWRLHRPGITLK